MTFMVLMNARNSELPPMPWLVLAKFVGVVHWLLSMRLTTRHKTTLCTSRTMKTRLFAMTFIAATLPVASGQSLAPSAADSVVTSLVPSSADSVVTSLAPSSADSVVTSLAPSTASSTFASLMPSVVDENGPLGPPTLDSDEPLQSAAPTPLAIDPSCSAHPECLALDLADPCCPTVDDVFLACCDLGDSAPTPGASTPAPVTPAPVTPAPATPAPFASSIMPSTETGIDTSMPTDAGTGSTTSAPSGGTPSPSIVTLTPKNYSGCIKVNGDGDEDDDFRLVTCDKSDPKQQFSFVGDQIQLAMDPSKCVQAGRDPMPSDGKYLRVYNCDANETLQRFSWAAPDGALTLLDFPDLAVVFRGVSANVNSDPIILGDLGDSDVATRKDWIILE